MITANEARELYLKNNHSNSIDDFITVLDKEIRHRSENGESCLYDATYVLVKHGIHMPNSKTLKKVWARLSELGYIIEFIKISLDDEPQRTTTKISW